MHDSFEGSANVTGSPQFQSGRFLLEEQDQSGACLDCHNSADAAPTGYHVSTSGSAGSPMKSLSGSHSFVNPPPTAVAPASLFGPYARDYCNKCHAKD